MIDAGRIEHEIDFPERSNVAAVNAMTHSAELGDLLQASIGLGSRLAKATG